MSFEQCPCRTLSNVHSRGLHMITGRKALPTPRGKRVCRSGSGIECTFCSGLVQMQQTRATLNDCLAVSNPLAHVLSFFSNI